MIFIPTFIDSLLTRTTLDCCCKPFYITQWQPAIALLAFENSCNGKNAKFHIFRISDFLIMFIIKWRST